MFGVQLSDLIILAYILVNPFGYFHSNVFVEEAVCIIFSGLNSRVLFHIRTISVCFCVSHEYFSFVPVSSSWLKSWP